VSLTATVLLTLAACSSAPPEAPPAKPTAPTPSVGTGSVRPGPPVTVAHQELAAALPAPGEPLPLPPPATSPVRGWHLGDALTGNYWHTIFLTDVSLRTRDRTAKCTETPVRWLTGAEPAIGAKYGVVITDPTDIPAPQIVFGFEFVRLAPGRGAAARAELAEPLTSCVTSATGGGELQYRQVGQATADGTGVTATAAEVSADAPPGVGSKAYYVYAVSGDFYVRIVAYAPMFGQLEEDEFSAVKQHFAKTVDARLHTNLSALWSLPPTG
jgi:hypothetical protein